eukprot:15457306-Alexandrium_andersonii.AAC.1
MCIRDRVQAPALQDPQHEEGVEIIIAFGRIKAPSVLQAAIRRGEPQEEIRGARDPRAPPCDGVSLAAS